MSSVESALHHPYPEEPSGLSDYDGLAGSEQINEHAIWDADSATATFETADGQYGWDIAEARNAEPAADLYEKVMPRTIESGYFSLPRAEGETSAPIAYKAYAAEGDPAERQRTILTIAGFTAGTHSFDKVARLLSQDNHDVINPDRRLGTTLSRAEDIADIIEANGLQDTPIDILEQSQGNITTQRLLEVAEARGHSWHKDANIYGIAMAGTKINEQAGVLVENNIKSNLQELVEEGFQNGMLVQPAVRATVNESLYHLVRSPRDSANQVKELTSYQTDWQRQAELSGGRFHAQIHQEDKTFRPGPYADGMMAAYYQRGMRDILLAEDDPRRGTLAGMAVDPNDPNYRQQLRATNNLSVSTLVSSVLANGERQHAGHNDHVYHPGLTARNVADFVDNAAAARSGESRDLSHLADPEQQRRVEAERSLGRVAMDGLRARADQLQQSAAERIPNPATIRAVGVIVAAATLSYVTSRRQTEAQAA